MPHNVYNFRSVKHGDPERKLKMIPDAPPKALAAVAFAALTMLCGAFAFAAVYVARTM